MPTKCRSNNDDNRLARIWPGFDHCVWEWCCCDGGHEAHPTTESVVFWCGMRCFPMVERWHGGDAVVMPDYRRAKVPGGTWFFTVAIAERRQSLLTDHIDDLRHAFRVARAARPFVMDAVVVLPDHLHCLWTLPCGDADFPVRWAHIKQAFSRRIPWGERRSASRIAKRERGLWQRRYWEHLISDHDDLKHHFDYIHYNPVKHGHVATVADWPYSSFHRHVGLGVYPLDWAGCAGFDDCPRPRIDCDGGHEAHPT